MSHIEISATHHPTQHHSLLYTCACNNLSLRITNPRDVVLGEGNTEPVGTFSRIQHILQSQSEWKNSPYCMHDVEANDNTNSLACTLGSSLIGVESQISQLSREERIMLSGEGTDTNDSADTRSQYILYTCKNCNLKCFLHALHSGNYYAIKNSVLLSPNMLEVPDYSRVFRVRVLPPMSAEFSKKDYTSVAIKEHSNREKIPKQCIELQKEMQRRLLTAKREMERRIERFAEVERRCFERMMRRTCEVERRLLFAQILEVSDEETGVEHSVDNVPLRKAINAPLNDGDMRHGTDSVSSSVGTSITNPQDIVNTENAVAKAHQDLEQSFHSLESNDEGDDDEGDDEDLPPAPQQNSTSLDNDELSADQRTTSDDQITPTTPKTPNSSAPLSQQKEVLRSPPGGASPPVRRRLFMRAQEEDYDTSDAPTSISAEDDIFISQEDTIDVPDSPNDVFLSSKYKETAVFELEGDEFTPLEEDESQSVKSSTESDDTAPTSPTTSTTSTSSTTAQHQYSNFKPQLTSPLAKKAMQNNRDIIPTRQSNTSSAPRVASSLPMNIAKGPSFLHRREPNPVAEYNSRYILEQPAASYIERYSDVRDEFFGQRLQSREEENGTETNGNAIISDDEGVFEVDEDQQNVGEQNDDASRASLEQQQTIIDTEEQGDDSFTE